jgi:hypothetical protein
MFCSELPYKVVPEEVSEAFTEAHPSQDKARRFCKIQGKLGENLAAF